jgi:hypothetical protein
MPGVADGIVGMQRREGTMPRVLFVFHGMGRQPEGWCGRVAAKLDEVASRYPRFRQRYSIHQFSELVRIEPITYDDVLRDKLDAWQEATDEIRAVGEQLRNDSLSRLADWLTPGGGASADESRFFWSHAVDLLLYALIPDVRNDVRAQCLAQMSTVLEDRLLQPSVLAHSLGTKVAHDALHLLATAAAGPGTEGLTADAEYCFRNVITVANVGAVLSEVMPDIPRVDRSHVHPIGVPTASGPGRGYCEQYLDFKHRLDPFTRARPFRPDGWGGRFYTSPRPLDHFPSEWNPHGFVHFLDHPAVHMPLMRAMLPFTDPLFTESEIRDAVTAYQGSPFPRCERAILDFEIRLQALAMNIEHAADAADIAGIVMAMAKLWTVVEQSRSACVEE